MEYGWMPFLACDRCQARWPTRYQYIVHVDGPDGAIDVHLCSICFGKIFEFGVRTFNLSFTGRKAMQLSKKEQQ